MDHCQQVAEVDAELVPIVETDDHEAFFRCRDIARNERVRGIDQGNPLEVDIRLRKLRGDDLHVILHAAQDGFRHVLRLVTAQRRVAMDFLDPFQVDDRHYANQQIGILHNVERVGFNPAMQSFIKQQIGFRRHLFPGR